MLLFNLMFTCVQVVHMPTWDVNLRQKIVVSCNLLFVSIDVGVSCSDKYMMSFLSILFLLLFSFDQISESKGYRDFASRVSGNSSFLCRIAGNSIRLLSPKLPCTFGNTCMGPVLLYIGLRTQFTLRFCFPLFFSFIHILSTGFTSCSFA